jgi:hypothetical protein
MDQEWVTVEPAFVLAWIIKTHMLRAVAAPERYLCVCVCVCVCGNSRVLNSGPCAF